MMEGKKIKGRKRHILVDTLGMILDVKVHNANIHDSKGALILFTEIEKHYPSLKIIWADNGYRGVLKHILNRKGINIEITNSNKIIRLLRELKSIEKQQHYLFPENDNIQYSDKKSFSIAPKRWVVERTFSWLYRNRRLSKDYECKSVNSESFCYISMIRLMLNRISKDNYG